MGDLVEALERALELSLEMYQDKNQVQEDKEAEASYVQ